MFQNIGLSGLILILIIALVIFGPKKLPKIGRSFGQTLKEFKKSARELTEDEPEMKKNSNVEARKETTEK